jgi:hypothetical protein
MSWSITRTGTPEEVGDAIKHAILQSANYTPLSQRRSRTAELAAANIRAIVVGATEHGVSTGAKPPQIVGYSSGHINDDGSMSTGSMSFSFVREIPKAAEPAAVTAPGPDAATKEEVDAALSGAGIPERDERWEETFGDLKTDEAADAPTAASEQSPLVDDAGGLSNEPTTTA